MSKRRNRNESWGGVWGRRWPFLLGGLLMTGVLSVEAWAIDVDVNVNVKHTVGGISTFDRSKFITIHSSHTDREWEGGQRGADNFTDDLLADFILGYDVYFGRDTGYITWYLKNNLDEDPSKPGWARESGSVRSIATQGTSARNSYNARTDIHAYESRSDEVIAAQFEPFWPDGTLTARGWALSTADTVAEPLGSATAAYMGGFLNHFYESDRYAGRPLPRWVEVMNEPDWPLMDNGDTPASTVWQYHNTVANGIRDLNQDVAIGGYCTTFPDLEENNFQEWREEWRLFIDMCGTNMDFYSLHTYDFPVFGGGGSEQRYRKGSNLEATFDMIEQYSQIRVGTPLPFVVSEYGAATHQYFNSPWSAYRDWLKVKSMSSMMMSFMDRPHLMIKAIPFIICKAEWGRGTVPYNDRLMRQANEPDSYTGEWVYTEMVKFYQLWSDVNGTRVDSHPSDVDIQTDAYVNGNKAYVILNNLNEAMHTIDVNLVEDLGNPLQNVKEKNMYWNGSIIALDETVHAGSVPPVQLAAEGTVILEYTFANPVSVHHTSDETKHYATTYFQPILGRETMTFEIRGVEKGMYGEAVLRLGMGREHPRSKEPVVLFNGTRIDVPGDFMGHEGDDRDLFFGELDIPVPYALLQRDNTISVTYPDSGGYVSSVSLRSYVFSTDVRGGGGGGSHIYDASATATTFVLSATNGVPLGRFDLLSTADLMVPVMNWATNQAGLQFDEQGAATITNEISGGEAYFVIQECVGCPPPATHTTALFDFHIETSDWSGNVDAPSTQGAYRFSNAEGPSDAYTMQLQESGDGTRSAHIVHFHGGANDGPHAIDSRFRVLDAERASQTFSVISLNWRNTAGGTTDANLVGLLGGAEQWRLSGNADFGDLVTEAGSGDLHAPIDAIRWYLPAENYQDDIFGSALDNLTISIPAAP